ncbi:MAG: hypothetical protein CM15mP107_2460 [Bacteroidota bacterium]|nr:MAG: hypothetical protein CM15mP107_2460 [Bacteroidota bacterium]
MAGVLLGNPKFLSIYFLKMLKPLPEKFFVFPLITLGIVSFQNIRKKFYLMNIYLKKNWFGFLLRIFNSIFKFA